MRRPGPNARVVEILHDRQKRKRKICILSYRTSARSTQLQQQRARLPTWSRLMPRLRPGAVAKTLRSTLR